MPSEARTDDEGTIVVTQQLCGYLRRRGEQVAEGLPYAIMPAVRTHVECLAEAFRQVAEELEAELAGVR